MTRALILGATSAIATEVAQLWADRGWRLHLVGRSSQKLAALQVRLAATSASLSIATADFNLLSANDLCIRDAIAALGGLDVVLVAHGYLGDQEASEREPAEAELILRTNLLSAVSLLIPVANHMERERAGSIAVMTSVAGERGRPRNYTYGAAKAALNVYLQGLRTRLVPAGVKVTTLKLGPVDSPMTAGHVKNLLFARPEAVAKTIVAAIDNGAAEVYAPWYWRPIMQVVRATPEGLFGKLRFLSGR